MAQTDYKLNFVKDDDIYIHGRFDEDMSENVISFLPSIIKSQSNNKEGVINIYINSDGGYSRYVWDLVAFIEQAKSKDIKVITYALSEAHSCGSILAVCGSERYISKNSEQLVHLGSSGFTSRTNLQLERHAKAVKKHFERVTAHYKKYCKIPKLESKLKDDWYTIYDQELIDFGMADKFIEDEV